MINIRHTGVYVRNLESMKDFYCDNFNMLVKVHSIEKGQYIETVLGTPGIKIDVCKLVTENENMLELIQVIEQDERRSFGEGKDFKTNLCSVGTAHLAITVDNVDLIYHKLKMKGIYFLSAPQISDDGKAKVCFCKDLEGNYLELVEEL